MWGPSASHTKASRYFTRAQAMIKTPFLLRRVLKHLGQRRQKCPVAQVQSRPLNHYSGGNVLGLEPFRSFTDERRKCLYARRGGIVTCACDRQNYCVSSKLCTLQRTAHYLLPISLPPGLNVSFPRLIISHSYPNDELNMGLLHLIFQIFPLQTT